MIEHAINRSSAEHAGHLRRIAAVVLAEHRDRHGFVGAALVGSLCLNAVWPSSDLDLKVVPLPGAPQQRCMAYGEREGILWHTHLCPSQDLSLLKQGYPDSFIHPPGTRDDVLDKKWYLDGLATMEVAEDPEGLLTSLRDFVAARRFAPAVWAGRRGLLLGELWRLRDQAQACVATNPDFACGLLAGDRGFGVLAGDLWLEGARHIYSGKEQDGLLAELCRAAGHDEAHEWYRCVMGVQPGRADAAVPLILALGEQADGLFGRLAALPAPRPWAEQVRTDRAWNRHLTGTLSLAPGRGHPAYVYQRLGWFLGWAVDLPRQAIALCRQAGMPGALELQEAVRGMEVLAEQIRATLTDLVPAGERARRGLAAAEKLLHLSERVFPS
jgi:hypothetical protein